MFYLNGIKFLVLLMLVLITACTPSETKKRLLFSPYNHLLLSTESAPYFGPWPEEKQCADLPQKPVTALYFESVYDQSDETRSTVDQESLRNYREKTRNLRKFENHLSMMANQYLLSGKTRKQEAACAMEWLFKWASAEALLGKSNSQGDFIRQWTLASLASSYTQIRSFEPANSEQKQIIEKWLSRVANRVIERYPVDLSEAGSSSLLNNHLYWAAWAVTITGVAINDEDKYRWGVDKARYALLVQAQDNGTFPLELKRGKKALQYHIFAMSPLVMIAETAKANNEDLYKLRDRMIAKIIETIFDDISGKAGFDFLAGTKQQSIDNISPEHFAWLEVYNARFPDPAYQKFLETKRPVFARRVGGDLTALFARE